MLFALLPPQGAVTPSSILCIAQGAESRVLALVTFGTCEGYSYTPGHELASGAAGHVLSEGCGSVDLGVTPLLCM